MTAAAQVKVAAATPAPMSIPACRDTAIAVDEMMTNEGPGLTQANRKTLAIPASKEM
jgi:hypothetical protein